MAFHSSNTAQLWATCKLVEGTFNLIFYVIDNNVEEDILQYPSLTTYSW